MTRPPLGQIVRGIALLGRFERRGFVYLGDSPRNVLASLAPLLALLIVSAASRAVNGIDARLTTWILAALSVLLLPMVVSEALARWWGRSDEWPRYAAAFNWCQWAVTFAMLAALLAANLLAALGLPAGLAAGGALLLVLAYHLSLQWFLVRRGLDLSPARSLAMVVAVEGLTGGVLLLFVVMDGGLAGTAT